MTEKSILILGGYGNAGLAIARLCLEHTTARLTLAGRSQSRAVEMAAQLNGLYKGFRVAGIQADASKAEDLRRALVGIDLLVVASSTSAYAEQVASVALSMGVNYLDIQYSAAKVKVLQSMGSAIEESGQCFITDGGFHPGIPGALVRYAAEKISYLERAVVGAVLSMDWGRYNIGSNTEEEFAAELLDYRPLVFRDGHWRKAALWRTRDFLKMDFGEPIGRVYTVPMMLDEMQALPDMIPSLQNTGFYISGFNWFVDWVLLPAGTMAVRMWPKATLRPVSRLLFWGMDKFSRPPYGIVLQMEAMGKVQNRTQILRVRLAHEDGYFLTAAPTVACILQYLEESVTTPGLHFMAHVVDPERMLKDMEKMGVMISIQEEAEA